MKQLSLFDLSQKTENPKSTVKKLTRNRLARLDYEMECPLSFVKANSYCHNCALFDGGEVDLSTTPPQATMRCRANEVKGKNVGFKPGHIYEGWRSTVAWVEKVYADNIE